MNQVHQGLRSMQPTAATTPVVLLFNRVDSNMDKAPQEPANICTHHIFMTVHVVTGRISSDNSGHFPVTSNRGNAYVALFYINNANAIWSVPIKNRSKEELIRAVTEVYAWPTAQGYWPLLHKMDNETSHDVKAFIASEQVKLQYCSPDMHRTNPAKPVVRTCEEPLHGRSPQTPTIVPPCPLVPTHNAKQCHAQHDVPVLP